MSKILEVKDLTIAFAAEQGDLPAVTEVDFSLEKGEILALVGESGCGKSVTCMSLAKLLPSPPAVFKKGKILLHTANGVKDVAGLSGRELREIRGGEIAYIFQEPSVSLNPVFRVGDQIAEALTLHRRDVPDVKEEVVELLRKVGIPDPAARANCYPHELSGGMQQRIMIAMALASNPSILIADEPTTALDVTIQAQILELLQDLRKDYGMSVILVTHNLGIVAEVADSVAVMYAGRIVEYAAVEELLTAPSHPYTKALLASVPVPGGEKKRLATIPGSVPLPAEYPAGCRFSTRCTACMGSREMEKRCREINPLMMEVKKGHFCACHKFGEESCC